MEIKSTKRRHHGEVGVVDKVVRRNSPKTMLGPNESTRRSDFLKKKISLWDN